MRRDRRREIRLSSDEEQRWLTAARSLDLDFSSFVRQTVNSSLRAASVTHPPIPVPPSHWPVGEGVEVEDRETVLVGTAVERPPVPGRPEEGESGAVEDTRAFEQVTLVDGSASEAVGRVQPQDPPGGLSTVEVTSVTADPDDAASPTTSSACRNAAFHLIGKYCRFCGTVPQ